MNTVRRWRDLNGQSSPKRRSYRTKFDLKACICTILFASLIGTYLDILLVGEGFYRFPNRPFPTIFSFNILFTLVILPVLTTVMIWLFKELTTLFQRGLILAILFLLLPILEHLSEHFYVFDHASDWNHVYSSFGYVIFTLMIWKFYLWMAS